MLLRHIRRCEFVITLNCRNAKVLKLVCGVLLAISRVEYMSR